jgi:hypothetical protein
MHNKIIIAVLGLFAFTAANAQNGPTDKVDIIKNFEAQLLDADKIGVTPTLPALDTSTKYQDYTVPPRPIKVKYEAPKLKPLGMKAGAKEEQYHGYFKGGGGVPSSIYGELGYGFGVKDKFDARIWGRHHQANFKSRENQRFSNTDVLLNGNGMVTENMALEGKVGYTYDRVHYYGYDDSLFTYDPGQVRQNFKTLDIGFRLYNGQRNDADLNYFIAPKFYNLTDNYANKENGIDLGFGASKWFNDKHVFRLNMRTDFTTFRDTNKQQLNNIYIQPALTLHFGPVRLKVGGNFASNRDIFHIYPDAELAVRVFGDGIQLFAAANGDLRKNTYRTMSDYNPFIQIRNSELRNTDYRNYFGGIRGNLGWISYTIQGGYATAGDLALFQTFFPGDPQEGITRFQVVYDTVKITNFQGTVTLKPTQDITVSGTLSQNIYKPNNALAAWGLPGLEGNFSGEYRLLDSRAAFKANLYIADRIKRRDENAIPGKDNALFDFGLGASYRFSKYFGAFLDINNILNNRRERWHNYPMYGTNVLVGLTARF